MTDLLHHLRIVYTWDTELDADEDTLVESAQVVLAGATPETVQRYGTNVFQDALEILNAADVKGQPENDEPTRLVEDDPANRQLSFSYQGSDGRTYGRIIEEIGYNRTAALVTGREVMKVLEGSAHNTASQDFKSFYVYRMKDIRLDGWQLSHSDLIHVLDNPT